ncbi:hypothetical protein L2E82_31421 [Cichorium intybus]|nr:hypothetical protein L2E82_31421 [Cichorium intybus]
MPDLVSAVDEMCDLSEEGVDSSGNDRFLKDRLRVMSPSLMLIMSLGTKIAASDVVRDSDVVSSTAAAMVHNNTNKFTLVLYLCCSGMATHSSPPPQLNLLLSHYKFAQFFSLKPPCLWCVRLECFFEPQNTNSHRDLLCERHAKEVSQLGFCSNHRKLAESHDMCEDCSSGFREKSRNFVFSKVKQIDLVQSDGEDE